MEKTAQAAARKPARARPVKAASKDADLVRERRQLLIAAAISVFIEKGFHATTVRDIGRQAGMTQGTIYNYVESKDDILYLVCDQIVSQYQDETRKALDNSSDAAQRVRSAVRAVCQVMHDNQEGILLIYQESHALDARSQRVILARMDEFIGMFEAILAEAARELKVTLADAHLAANILTFLPTILVLRRWSLKPGQAPGALIDRLTDFLLRGLGFERLA